ncbi:MAG: DUF305 domain-containing protein [Pedobacter sp.]|nr:MAG: DUF305 domain-containing protein [Pedobacter sp.]
MFLIGLLSISVGFTSCKDDEDENSPHSHPASTISHDESIMMTIMHEMSARMDTMTMTHDADNDFAMMMIEHHMGAINMANEVIANGDDAHIKDMATTMKNAQMAEIQELQSFLQANSPASMDMEAMTEYMESMQKMDTSADQAILIGDVDHDFASLMIPHHQSAIDMAKTELQYGHSAELKTMAQKMIDDQQEEIAMLQEWLKTN